MRGLAILGSSFCLLQHDFPADEISGPLRGGSGLNDQVAVIVKGFGPALDVAGLERFSTGVLDPDESAQESSAELGNEFLNMLRATYRGICCPGNMLRELINEAIGRGASRFLAA